MTSLSRVHRPKHLRRPGKMGRRAKVRSAIHLRRQTAKPLSHGRFASLGSGGRLSRGCCNAPLSKKRTSASAAVSRIIGGKPKEAACPDLFAETVPPQPGKPRRTKKRDTAVIASVFIGIGNKPYLRGSGAGLNWEQGVAMEFEEIGKWRWIAPVELDEPVEVEVFRNDEDADQNGKHTLEPGQQLEISPSFQS